MHGVNPIDDGRELDWGRTSRDYAEWRPGYPAELYERLQGLGVGLPNQQILDLGTGVGFLARQFARQRANVVGIDIAQGQIEEARRRAADEGLVVGFHVAPAEVTDFPDCSFDVITAGQCWLYFERDRAISEVTRLLRPDGLLVTCHFCWLPREDSIARASEQLVLKHNPAWTAADWPGVIPPKPKWTEGNFEVVDWFYFDQEIAFNRESWRGRIRACRGVGATLSAEQVSQFDAEHEQLLHELTEPEFTVLHRIDAHIMRPVRDKAS